MLPSCFLYMSGLNRWTCGSAHLLTASLSIAAAWRAGGQGDERSTMFGYTLPLTSLFLLERSAWDNKHIHARRTAFFSVTGAKCGLGSIILPDMRHRVDPCSAKAI